jgi:predicted nuclease with TOPRIM domain
MKIIDQNLKEMKKAKSDSNVMKELNAEKEKLKDATDRINIEINKLKKKDEEIEDKLITLTP